MFSDRLFIVVIQLLSCVWLFETPWPASHPASLSFRRFSISWLLCLWGSPGKNTRVGLPCPSPGGSSWPRDGTCISFVFCIGRRGLYHQRHLGSPVTGYRLGTNLPKVTHHCHSIRRRHYFANKAPSGQGCGFSSGQVWMRELDCEEGWALKNWCFWTVVLEKTLESPLDCKEVQPVHPKGDQPCVFIGRTDAEAETPILWPPHAKSWLIGKDPDAGKDWGQEEKGTTEDEMVGWHHQLDGHGFGWTPGVGDGQGGLVCCGKSWTWLSDWTELKVTQPESDRTGIYA